MVFTISCSDGADGKDGANGTNNCIIEDNGDGTYQVMCGSEDLGEFVGGEPGENGNPGTAGQAGTGGNYCILQGTGSNLSVSCGTDNNLTPSAISLNSCENPISENDHEIIIDCKSSKVSLCDGKVFNPDKESCTLSGSIISNSERGLQQKEYCATAKGKLAYYKDREYCGFASEKDYVANSKSILKKCFERITEIRGTAGTRWGVTVPTSPDSLAIIEASPNDVAWGSSTVKAISGGVSFVDTAVTETGFYCSYSHPKSKGRLDTLTQCGDYKTFVKINEGSFKNEYCGFASQGAYFKSVVSKTAPSCPMYDINPSIDPNTGVITGGQISDTLYKGPNQDAFGAGYCASNRQGKLFYSEFYCKDGKGINVGKWLGQYCGFKTATDSIIRGKVVDGICDDNTTPNGTAYRVGYCKWSQTDKETRWSTDWCGGTTPSTYKTVNEGKWKKEYCACGDKDCTQSKKRVLSDICDDGKGPSEDEQNGGYCQANYKDSTVYVPKSTLCGNQRINEKTWQHQYCGYKSVESSENDTLYSDACDDGRGPNSDGFSVGYCKANRAGVTTLTVDFCGTDGKPNNGGWKGEYCGFESATSTEANTVLTGACDDGRGPNSDGFGVGYCQMATEVDTATTYTPNFCGTDGKTNEGSWKGEYCFTGDSKVAACTGGLIPNTDKNSTDPVEVRCSYASNPGCTTSSPWACTETECAALETEGAKYVWDGICKAEASSTETPTEQSKKKAKLALKK